MGDFAAWTFAEWAAVAWTARAVGAAVAALAVIKAVAAVTEMASRPKLAFRAKLGMCLPLERLLQWDATPWLARPGAFLRCPCEFGKYHSWRQGINTPAISACCQNGYLFGRDQVFIRYEKNQAVACYVGGRARGGVTRWRAGTRSAP